MLSVYIFSALASGGAVTISQLMGAEEMKAKFEEVGATIELK